jgi:hypothetical protein
VLLLRVYPTFPGNPTFVVKAVLECSRAECRRRFLRWTDLDVVLWTRQDRTRVSGSATRLSAARRKKKPEQTAFFFCRIVHCVAHFFGRRLSSCFRFDACSGVIFIAGTPRGQCALDHRGALPEFIDPCEVGPRLKG